MLETIVLAVVILWLICGRVGVHLIRKTESRFDLSFPYRLIFVSGLIGLITGSIIYFDYIAKKTRTATTHNRPRA